MDEAIWLTHALFFDDKDRRLYAFILLRYRHDRVKAHNWLVGYKMGRSWRELEGATLAALDYPLYWPKDRESEATFPFLHELKKQAHMHTQIEN